mmetsp:Transcript_14338/g.49010  ORF Transcript_14338/g.49010 Transcript_14338/m.49010 type:complete len:240 (-) Transcript_14338:970-1689(-)
MSSAWSRAPVLSTVTAFIARPFRLPPPCLNLLASPMPLTFSFPPTSLLRDALRPVRFKSLHYSASVIPHRGISNSGRNFSVPGGILLHSVRRITTNTTPKHRIGSTFQEFVASHRDELLNIGLASLLLVLTIKLVRIKGEGEDEAERLNKVVEGLQTTLERTKTKLEELALNETPAIASAISLKKGKEEILQEQILQIIRRGFEQDIVSKNEVSVQKEQKLNSEMDIATPTSTVKPKMI